MSRTPIPRTLLFLATSVVASCGGRVDLGGSGARDAGSRDAGAFTTGSGGSGSAGGASIGGAGSGGTEGTGGTAREAGAIDAASGSGGASPGGTTGDGGAPGSSGNDGGRTGGAPGSGGSASGGATADSGTSAGGTTSSGGAPSGGASSGGVTASGGAASGGAAADAGASGGAGGGATCMYNWDCLVDAAGCDSTLGGCACDVRSHVCVASHCVDERRDGTESDVDCGGECAGCGPGKVCYHDSDCSADATGCDQCACDVQTSTCVHNHCADHKLDGDETGLDCGGATCAKCTVGVTCKVDSDCDWGGCDSLSHTCTSSTCYDHHIDGVETDVDCGGPSACPLCFIGEHCLTNFDCVGGHFCNTSKVCQ